MGAPLLALAKFISYTHCFWSQIFQIDSVLGPLQLSLYKMLKDVGRFLFIYLLLYLSFATGVVKVYSFYVTSQIELQKQNMSSDPQDSHPYDKYVHIFKSCVCRPLIISELFKRRNLVAIKYRYLRKPESLKDSQIN